MRRKFLVITILFFHPFIAQSQDIFYYEMRVRPSLYTEITLKTIDTSLENKFKQSQFVRISSHEQNIILDIPISKVGTLQASSIIPYAEDWLVDGTVANGELIKDMSPNETYKSELSNISYSSDHLGAEEKEIKPIKISCNDNKIIFNSESNDNNLFVLLTSSERNGRFVGQYYGVFKKNIEISCMGLNDVFLRYTGF